MEKKTIEVIATESKDKTKSTQCIHAIKIQIVDNHFLVQFKYPNYEVYHTLDEVLDAIGREVSYVIDDPYPFEPDKNLDKLTSKQKEKANEVMGKIREKHLEKLNMTAGQKADRIKFHLETELRVLGVTDDKLTKEIRQKYVKLLRQAKLI